MATVQGLVERIVFRNEENGYTVLSLISGEDQYTLVGTFHYINEGEMMEATGSISEHPMYGEQMVVEAYELKPPEDVVSIERYLASGAIKGVGPALASRIVKHFKADTFRIIEEEPERLSEVKGVSEKMARQITSQMEEKRDMREAMIFLQNYGISLNLAVKIYQEYGPRLYQIIQNNPYQMADDIAGVGFRIADEIARKVGIFTDSDFRIKSGILYTLLQASANGHTYLPQGELLRNTGELLGIEVPDIEKHIMDMVIDKRLMVKEQMADVPGSAEQVRQRMVYASRYYYTELNTAKMLHDLNIVADYAETDIKSKLYQIQKETKMELDSLQQQAVMEAVNCGVLIITGGPGTGKTTTINTIIRYFENEGLNILLAAPTGRAAKRMTEATGCEARTIHRMLELTGMPDEGNKEGTHFERNEENPLEADVVIIDEMSMVDIFLMHSLLRAVSVGTRLILVGDVNQLPSVGPGNVLKDIIASNQFHVVKLTRIFRQASQSDIVVNAHKINAGEQIPLNKKSNDFLFIKRDDANAIISAMLTLVKEKLPRYVNAGVLDIQIMTPMRKGALGVERLNGILQQFLNPPAKDKEEKELPQGIFRVGDKVMQVKNNYQLEWEVKSRYEVTIDKGMGVFNGDMGIIRQVNLFAETLTVEFDEGRMVDYSFKQAEELELAYAITIHKSQGSEYPAVVIPLLSGPRMLMTRNLIYTAVTRAKACVCLVGVPQTFQSMVDNETEQRRYSGLEQRIEEIYDTP